MGDQFELLGDAMHYVMIEERLMESLRMKWEDVETKGPILHCKCQP